MGAPASRPGRAPIRIRRVPHTHRRRSSSHPRPSPPLPLLFVSHFMLGISCFLFPLARLALSGGTGRRASAIIAILQCLYETELLSSMMEPLDRELFELVFGDHGLSPFCGSSVIIRSKSDSNNRSCTMRYFSNSLSAWVFANSAVTLPASCRISRSQS